MHHLLLWLAIGVTANASATTSVSLVTHAEQTHFTETGRYAEVETLSRRFEAAFPGKVKRVVFGRTPEGRPMIALVASADGTLTSALAAKRARPVIFFQGGIHAGEIDGKDAGFRVLRDLLTEPSRQNILKNLTVVFVPVFNIDGHERFGPNNRPNQIGPAEMGWRVTSQNLNLNRDYAKADAPEMLAMLAFHRGWDPLISLDLHVTDGAEFQHDIAFMVQPTLAGPLRLTKIGNAIKSSALVLLEEKGHLPLSIYPSFEKEDEPKSGIGAGVTPPRLSHGYWSARNRIGILVETHSWKDYATRVHATEDALWATLTLASAQGSKWLKEAHEVDTEALAEAGSNVALAYEHTAESHEFDFLGYAYSFTHSDVSGQDWIHYDRAKKETWKIPVFDRVKPTLTVHAPLGGYLILPAYAALVLPRLQAHGIAFTVIKGMSPESLLQAFHATEIGFAKDSFEGHQRLTLTGAWTSELRALPPGTVFVPIRQRLSFLAMHLLEPMAPDSFVSWGFFNSAFEKKEYMEDYVTEVIAQQLLKNPTVAAEFKKSLQDKEFAASPKRRLEFFHRRHPSWDERYGLVPIFRTDQTLEQIRKGIAP